MADIVPFHTKSRNNATWTPKQMAEEFIQDIASGEAKPIRAMFLFTEDAGNGRVRTRRYYCNIDTNQIISLLELAKTMEIEDWRS